MKLHHLLGTLCGILFLTSCGHSPESAGKKIGAGLCACRAEKQEKALKTTKEFKSDVDKGKFMSQAEASARMEALSAQLNREADECEEKVGEEEDEFLKEFLRDDDRGTIVNAKRMMVEECFRSRESEMKEHAEELMEMSMELQKAVMALPR